MFLVRGIGVLAIVLGGMGLAAVVANQATMSSGGHDLRRIVLLPVLSIVIGCGLVLRQKWAALLCIILSLGVGAWTMITSIARTPVPWMVDNVVVGCVCMVPGVIVIWKWSELGRGRRSG